MTAGEDQTKFEPLTAGGGEVSIALGTKWSNTEGCTI